MVVMVDLQLVFPIFRLLKQLFCRCICLLDHLRRNAMIADVKKANPLCRLAKLSSNLLHRLTVARTQGVYVNYRDFVNCDRFSCCVAHRDVKVDFKLQESDLVDTIAGLIFDG